MTADDSLVVNYWLSSLGFYRSKPLTQPCTRPKRLAAMQSAAWPWALAKCPA